MREDANDFLPRLWATRRVGWLMEQVRTNGEQQELRDEIVDLGTRYGIVTPYTSYLALEPNVTARDVTSLPVNNRSFGAGRSTNAPPPRIPFAGKSSGRESDHGRSGRAAEQTRARTAGCDEG